MAVKLIASDLDGTLMAPDHMTVSERTKKALLDAHEKGIKIAIATGRTLHFTDSVTAHGKKLLDERVAAAEKMAELYDENGDFRQELIDEIMAQAVELSFAEETETLTFETTFGFVYQGKQWYVVPDGAFMRALSGGLS